MPEDHDLPSPRSKCCQQASSVENRLIVPQLHNNVTWNSAELTTLPDRVARHAARDDNNPSSGTGPGANPPPISPGRCPERRLVDSPPNGNMFCCKKDATGDDQVPTADVVFGAVQDLCHGIFLNKAITFGRTSFTEKVERAYKQPNNIRALMTVEYNADAPECKGDVATSIAYKDCEDKFKQAFGTYPTDQWYLLAPNSFSLLHTNFAHSGPNGGVVYEKCMKYTLDVHPEVSSPWMKFGKDQGTGVY